MTIDEYAWPLSRLGDVLSEMGHRSGLAVVAAAIAAPPQECYTDPDALALWLDQTATGQGLEAEPVETPYARVETLLRHSSPLLLRLPVSDTTPARSPLQSLQQSSEGEFLALLDSRGDRLRLLGVDGKTHWVDIEEVRVRLCGHWEVPLLAEIEEVVAAAGIEEDRQGKVRTALLNQQLADFYLTDCWVLRSSQGDNLWAQIRQSRLFNSLGISFAADIFYQLLLLLSWVMIGRGALQGHFEWVWLWAWALLLFSMIPVQAVVSWAQQQIAQEGMLLLRQRLLYGALRIDPESVRHGGVGYFLDRVLDVEAMEGLAISGGFSALLASVQVASACVVLYLGIGGAIHVGLLFFVLLYTLAAGWFYYRRYHAWDDAHRELTTDLVEQMVGHRTRLAQEAPAHRHGDEDQLLTRYLKRSEQRDISQLFLGNAIPQVWLLVGLAWLSYQAIYQPASVTELALSVGGVLLAWRALGQLIQGGSSLVRALVAWHEIAPIAQAAGTSAATVVDPGLVIRSREHSSASGMPLLTGHQVSYRYRSDDTPVLSGVDFSINVGERLLLEGPSGGGKSTLAGLLAGVRQPDSGLLLLNGYDQQALGEENWRRQAVLAPQFHENFVFTGTLAYNLLLGRRWPPEPVDLQEAEDICRELGLGDLLDRMPGGLTQEVGESGWQLSHGERSRLYMARALLQKADLLVLDESFAALDPDSLEQALQCVWRRAPTLVVIAHP